MSSCLCVIGQSWFSMTMSAPLIQIVWDIHCKLPRWKFEKTKSLATMHKIYLSGLQYGLKWLCYETKISTQALFITCKLIFYINAICYWIFLQYIGIITLMWHVRYYAIFAHLQIDSFFKRFQRLRKYRRFELLALCEGNLTATGTNPRVQQCRKLSHVVTSSCYMGISLVERHSW